NAPKTICSTMLAIRQPFDRRSVSAASTIIAAEAARRIRPRVTATFLRSSVGLLTPASCNNLAILSGNATKTSPMTTHSTDWMICSPRAWDTAEDEGGGPAGAPYRGEPNCECPYGGP